MQNLVIVSNGKNIWYETFGSKENPAVLLNMGNGCDAMMWPDAFCESLAQRKFCVIRFDQRDTGLSTWVDFSKEPYTLMDMVNDCLGLLDALNISKAHIVGFSTGGLIAQLLTIHFPDRVLSLILMMTSIDLTIKNDAFLGLDLSQSKLPPPKQEYIKAVKELNAVSPTTQIGKIKLLVENFKLANGSKSPYDEAFFYQLFENSLNRVRGKLGKVGHESNHALATSRTPIISEQEFASISRPTLVIAGSEDPIFPPTHAEATSRIIPGANLLMVEGMGHILNPVFFQKILDAMVDHMKGE